MISKDYAEYEGTLAPRAAVSHSIPLICPACLHSEMQEHRLDPALTCPSCHTRYPMVDGIPVLIADDGIRQGIAAGAELSDARSRFYQEPIGYLRDRLEGSKEIEYALGRSAKRGLVLEVGSGRGVFAGIGDTNYCGLDYSLGNLRQYLKGHRRLCASAEMIPLASGSCRLVFSFATYEHVPHPDLAFAEVDRVLAVGGVACLAPAWHCRDWAAEGLGVRPYRDLSFKQKIRKALIPLRDSIMYRGAVQIPWRMYRRALTRLSDGRSRLHYRHLNANYEYFWCADSDACSNIDSHEGILFFDSRRYEVLEPRGGSLAKLLFRGGPAIVRKTSQSLT